MMNKLTVSLYEGRRPSNFQKTSYAPKKIPPPMPIAQVLGTAPANKVSKRAKRLLPPVGAVERDNCRRVLSMSSGVVKKAAAAPANDPPINADTPYVLSVSNNAIWMQAKGMSRAMAAEKPRYKPPSDHALAGKLDVPLTDDTCMRILIWSMGTRIMHAQASATQAANIGDTITVSRKNE